MTLDPRADLPLDTETPGGVYLCQVGDHVSCGACCGLYNIGEDSPAHLEGLLRSRTLRFAATPRTAEGIDAFARDNAARESQERPFDDFHHCPFIGWIAGDPGRVGCLLHPMGTGNNGVDLRGLSYYGGLACRTYFCPSTHRLLPRYKRIVRWVMTDWYRYGMVVTEDRLIEALFAQIETGRQALLDLGRLIAKPDARRTLEGLLGLKCRWPYRPANRRSACHYFFTENPHPKPAIDYHRLGVPVSIYDTILRELVSEFQDVDELRAAEEIVRQEITSVLESLRRGVDETHG
jgi:hypothetical protein